MKKNKEHVPDCPDNNSFNRPLEMAYRRGFCQGYCMAIEHFKYKKISDMEKFLDDDLCDWRYRKHQNKVYVPPEIK